MPRDSKNYEIKETWDDVLGMRATRSDAAILNGVFIPDKYIIRERPTGFKKIDSIVPGIFTWALMGFGKIYYGLTQRVVDMILGTIGTKKSVSLVRPSMAYHSGIQHDIAEMVLELEGIGPHLDTIAKEWSEGKGYGAAWGVKYLQQV